jgi:beta-N-acetylhexosaminidase
LKNYEKKIYVIFMAVEIVILILVGAYGFLKHQRSSSNKDKNAVENTELVQTEEQKEEAKTTEESASQTSTLEKSVEEKLETMSLEEKVAQLFILSPEALTGVDLVEQAGEQTKQAIQDYPIGGLFYVSANMGSEEQIKNMLVSVQKYSQDRIGLPLFLGIQEEGGTVSPFEGNTSFKLDVESASTLGKNEDTDATYNAGKSIGSYMNQLGFNFNIGPVADITKTSTSLTKKRSFGTNTEKVASQVAAQVKGLKEEKVSPVLKYFPGKGNVSEEDESDYATTDITLEDLRDSDLKVYESGIEAGAECIMVGHIIAENLTGDDTLSSMSEKVITDILRGELNYDGLVMTESLSASSIVNNYTPAEAAVKLIQAGGDIIFLPDNFEEAYQGILDAVNDGTITEDRINESVKRILRIKLEDN